MPEERKKTKTQNQNRGKMIRDEDKRGGTVIFNGNKHAEIQSTDRNKLWDTKIGILSRAPEE